MYLIMNKNNLIATFDIKTEFDDSVVDNVSIYGALPIGVSESDLGSWVKNRHATKHRKHLNAYLKKVGAYNIEGFIKLTHAISINDTYWIKEENEPVTWGDVSPYENEFDEAVQHLAFDGVGLYGEKLSSTSPEFGTAGAYEKCWVRENGSIYLYKRGTEGFSNGGLEPYCEYLASQVFDVLHAGIGYDLVKYRNKMASKCKLFTDDNVGFAPYSVVNPDCNKGTPKDLLNYFDRFSAIDNVKRMLICDALTFNTDRHYGNFGFLVNNDSQEIIFMASCFDYNLSLFPMEVNDAFVDVPMFIDNYDPKIGDTFVGIARCMLDSKLRSELINLKGFEYQFDGDEKFSKDRVKWLSVLTNNQIDNILGTTTVSMYTSPNKEVVTNIYKYRKQMNMDEDAFIRDVPRLMKVLGVEHMSELEKEIVKLLE